MMEKLMDNWEKVLDYMMLENKFTPISYEAWVKYFKPYKVEDKKVLIVVEKSTIVDSDWFMKKYKKPLKIAILEVTGQRLDVEIFSLESYKQGLFVCK